MCFSIVHEIIYSCKILLERQSIDALSAASGSWHDETGRLSTVDSDLVNAWALWTSDIEHPPFLHRASGDVIASQTLFSFEAVVAIFA